MHAAGYALDPEFQLVNDHSSEITEGLLTIMERMLDSPAAVAQAMVQLQQYRSRNGIFGRASVIAAVSTMPAYAWWQMFGAGVPELQRVAVRVLAQVSSASSCERNWSAYGFVHNRLRNRLNRKRAADLVYVHQNLRMLKRIHSVGYEELMPAWEEADESDEEVEADS